MFEVLHKGFLQDWNKTLSQIIRTVGQEIPYVLLLAVDDINPALPEGP